MSMVAFVGYAVLFFVAVGAVVVNNTDRAIQEAREEASLSRAEQTARATKRAAQQAEKELRNAADRETVAKKEIADQAAAYEKACRNDITAYVMAQEYVKERLKAPATAKFPHINDRGVEAKYLGNCTHRIVGYVDAQNGFGAMLRTHYAVQVMHNPKTDGWAVLEEKINN